MSGTTLGSQCGVRGVGWGAYRRTRAASCRTRPERCCDSCWTISVPMSDRGASRIDSPYNSYVARSVPPLWAIVRASWMVGVAGLVLASLPTA